MVRLFSCASFFNQRLVLERRLDVVLQRDSTDESWGLHITGSEDGLFIQALQDSPSLAKWHREHPGLERRILPAQAIVTVNGHEEKEEIWKQLRSATFVEMSLSSLLTPSQRASYWAVIRREREVIFTKNAVAPLLEDVKMTDCQCVGQLGQCSICLDEMDENSKVVKLSCGHHFHKRCVTKWLLTKKITCPLCKQKPLPVGKPELDSTSLMPGLSDV